MITPGRCGAPIVAAALLWATGCSRPGPTPPPTDNGPRLVSGEWALRLDRHLTSLVPIGLSGSVVVVRAGEVVLEASYGWADRSRRIANTNTTAFDIASVTKVITAVAVMQLAERGALRLDDSIALHLELVPADKKGITVRQLLAHRSGLQLYHDEDVNSLDKADALRRILAAELRFAPGSQYGYSNSGYTLLAAVVEAVTRTPFRDHVRQEIFDAARMERTAWFGERRWADGELAHGYASQEDRGAGRATNEISWTLLGAGGIVSTASDLSRLVRALTAGSLLSQASVALLMKASEPCPAPLTDNALGFGVWRSADGSLTAEKGGYAGGRGYSAMVRFRPSTGDAVIFTLNDDWDELYPVGIHNALVRTIDRGPAAASSPLDVAPVTTKIPSGTFAAPAGRLRIEKLTTHWSVRADGQQLITFLLGLSDQPAARLDAANRRANALVAGRDSAPADSGCAGELLRELGEALRDASDVRVMGSTPEWLLDTPDEVTYVSFRRDKNERVLRLHWANGVLHDIGGGSMDAPFLGELTNGSGGLQITHVPLGSSVRIAADRDALTISRGGQSIVLEKEDR